MKYKILMVLVFCLMVISACNNNQGSEQKDQAATAAPAKDSTKYIEVLDQEASALIDSTANIEVISHGYKWSEGPVYISDSDYLLFSDVPANKIYKWKEGSGTSLYLDPSGFTGTTTKSREPGSNGLVIDKNGKLVLCQQGDRQIGRMKTPLSDPKPSFEVITGSYNGKKYNSPNDAVYAANGNLYFTDPPYGLEKGLKDSSKELSFQGVFLVKPGGKPILVTDKVTYPNGIALSPDNKYLYISNSDSDNKEWTRYELNKDGLVAKDTLFYRVSAEEAKGKGGPDGMKVDSKGYIYATAPGGIWLFNPAGKVIARIYTGQRTSNCSIDQLHHMLYMTCDSLVMRVKLKG